LLFDVFFIVPLLFFQSTDCFADKLLRQTIKNFLFAYFFRVNIFKFQCLCISRVIPQRRRAFELTTLSASLTDRAVLLRVTW